MNKKDVTIIFSDLEGTILREKDQDFSPEQFQLLINKIHKFLSITNTQLSFVILSPIEAKYMIPIVERIQNEFDNFNMKNGTRYSIDFAACYKESDDIRDLPKYILPMLDGIAGKKRVVNYYVEEAGRRTNIRNTIYMGNGRNDIDSVEYLRAKYRENAYTICPRNSRTKLRTNPRNFIGEETDLKGLISGFDKLLNLVQDKNKNTFTAPTDPEDPMM